MKAAWLLIPALLGCNRVYYSPSHRIHGDAAKAGYAFVDHRFPSPSGNRLHGRFFPRKEGTESKGLWIFFHGSGRNLTGSYSLYAWVTAAGWDYFIFDYSGYGESGGEPAREPIYKDGLAALDYAVRTFPSAGEGKLVLSGESLGGAVLLGSAADWEGRRRASLIFVDCAFPTYRKAGKAMMAERIWTWPFQFLAPLLVSDGHSPAPVMDRLEGIPLLVSHCRGDRKIPLRMGEQLFAAAKEPKTFWLLEDCAHTQGFTDRFPANRRALLAFADSVPKAAAP